VPTTDELGNPITLFRASNLSTASGNTVIQNVDGFQYLDPNGNVIGTANPNRKYKAFMAVLNKRYTNRWQAQVSYVFAKATGNVDNTGAAQVSTRQFETPNLALVNSEGDASNTTKHEFKLLGSYQIPKIETSVNAYFRATSGLPYNRIQQFSTALVATGSSTTYRRIPINPRGTYDLPALSQLDLRVEKNFNVMGSNRIGIYGDIENLFNRGIVTSVVTRTTSTTLSDGSTFPLPFETPTALQNPRQLRIGARWSF